MKEGSGTEKKMADEQMTNGRTDGMRRGKKHCGGENSHEVFLSDQLEI